MLATGPEAWDPDLRGSHEAKETRCAPPAALGEVEQARGLGTGRFAPAVAAFECHDELQAHVARYTTNRQIMLDGLRAAGIDRLAPAEGAFYVYADVSDLTDSSSALCADWLAQIGVAATPGIDFDPYHGERYVRFSFCGGTDTIERGVELLNTWSF